MGKWTLESINCQFTKLNGQTYGHNVYGNFRLKYTPALFSGFKDTPKLIWYEKIMMVQHDKGERWFFEVDQYLRNPFSPTMRTWYERYVFAYNKACGYRAGKGKSELLDRNGRAVSIDTLGRGITNPGEKANAVRSYLKNHGGIMEIQIHDVPAINKPKEGKTVHKERLLQFDCGVEGMAPRFKLEQYLVVDSSKEEKKWESLCRTGWTKTVAIPTECKKVVPPSDVSIDKSSPTNTRYGRYL